MDHAGSGDLTRPSDPATNLLLPENASGRPLFRQGEDIHGAGARTHNVLFAAHRVADGTAGVGTPQKRAPKQLSRAGVQRHEVAVSAAAEHLTRSEAVERMPLSVLSTILNSHFFSPVLGSRARMAP